MGSLKQVVAQVATVKSAGGDFSVGPLSGADVLSLFIVHRQSVDRLFAMYAGGKETVDIFAVLAIEVPELGAEVIARAAANADGEGGAALDDVYLSAARRLDVGAQLDAIEKVGALTVSSAGGLGNMVALIERMAGSINQGEKSTPNPNPSAPTDGSKTSENNAVSFSETDTATRGNTPSG